MNRTPQQTTDDRKLLQQVQDWTLRLQRETTLESLYWQVLAALGDLTGAFAQRVQLRNPITGNLRIQCFAGLPAASQVDQLDVSCASSTLCSEALRTHHPVYVQDVAVLSSFLDAATSESLQNYGVKSVYCVPMHSSDAQMTGLLTVYFDANSKHDDHSLFLTNIIAAQSSVLMDRIQTAERVKVAENRATLGRLAIALAHEVNNPLQALTNLLVLLTAQAERSADVHERASEALAQVGRISTLMAQMNELRPALQEDLQRSVHSFYKQ